MTDLINGRYQGCPITVGITGLPITITGTVINDDTTASTITLKLKDGKIINIAESLIAFFF